MHVHLLAIVWEQMWIGCYLHTGPHIFVQLCKGSEKDMRSQVDMHIFTGAFTPSDQGVGQDEGRLGHVCEANRGA